MSFPAVSLVFYLKRWQHLHIYHVIFGSHRGQALFFSKAGRERGCSGRKSRKMGKIQPHFCRNSISIIKIKGKRAETRYKIKDDNDDQTTTALTTFSSLGAWTGFKASHCSSLASEWKPNSARWPRISGQLLIYRLLPRMDAASWKLQICCRSICRTFPSSCGRAASTCVHVAQRSSEG